MAFSRCASSVSLSVCAFIVTLSLAGCSKQQNAEQALDKALSDAGQKRGGVFPLGGTVTIDGQVPKFEFPNQRLYVVLNDVKAPDAPVANRRRVACDPGGNFSFRTYTQGDGVPAGTYVVTFAVLRDVRKHGLEGPDGLNNLYNDPEKNANNAEFKIEHQAPGKSDYRFNLAVAGQAAVSEPGKFALTGLKGR